jgi:hypothetical protein
MIQWEHFASRAAKLGAHNANSNRQINKNRNTSFIIAFLQKLPKNVLEINQSITIDRLVTTVLERCTLVKEPWTWLVLGSGKGLGQWFPMQLNFQGSPVLFR